MAASNSQQEPCDAKEEPPCTGAEVGEDAAPSTMEPAAKEEIDTAVGEDAAPSAAEPAAKEEVDAAVGGDAAGSAAEPVAKEELDTPARDGASGVADGDRAADQAPPAAAVEPEADGAAAEVAEVAPAAADADMEATDADADAEPAAAEAAEAAQAAASAAARADVAAEAAEAGQAAADADMEATDAAADADADADAAAEPAAAEAAEAAQPAAGAAADADMEAADGAVAADADAAAETTDAPGGDADTTPRRGRGRPRVAASQPRRAAQRQRAQVAQGASAAAEVAGDELVEPKRPTSSYFLWFIENREAVSRAAGGGQGAGALAKLAGERWKGMSAEERAPYEAKAAEKKEEYRQALADFLARGGVPMRRARKEEEAPADQRPAKRPWGGAYGEYVRQHRQDVRSSMPASAQLCEVSRECARRWKELSEERRRPYQERFQASLDEFNATNTEVALPTGVTRSAMATQGAAKGWKVKAWLNVRNAVQFRILEPKQSGRAFRTFNNFKALRGNVDKKVYRQLSCVVKPALVRRLTARPARRAAAAVAATAAALQDETPPKRRRASGGEGGALVAAGARRGRAQGDLETPNRLERPLLATQAYSLADALRPTDQASMGEAYLVRHRRCAASQGPQQPQVIHLKGPSTTIGRSESNDVVLNSARFPTMLSRAHAKLVREGGAFSLIDQGSTNGVMVNGSSVKSTCKLRSGDIVTFGVQTAEPEFDYVFEIRAEAS